MLAAVRRRMRGTLGPYPAAAGRPPRPFAPRRASQAAGGPMAAGGPPSTQIFATASSGLPDPAEAAEQCVASLRAALGGAAPDLCLFFAGQHPDSPSLRGVPDVLGQLAPEASLAVIGASTAEGVLNPDDGTIAEDAPMLSVFAAALPATTVEAFGVPVEYDLSAQGRGLPPSGLAGAQGQASQLLLLCDTQAEGGLATEQYLQGLDVTLPHTQIAGALVIGSPEKPQLLYSSACGGGPADGWRERGAVGLELSGDTVIEAVTSAGVRPLGPTADAPYTLTSTGGYSNAIKELDDRPVADVLQEFQQSLGKADEEAAKGGLWAGLATGGHNPDGSPAYVTRSLLGMSPEHGLGVATTPGLL